jgi:transposase
MPKFVKRRKNKLAGRYRNRWPDDTEISGRMIPKWAADSCRNRWPDHPEIRKTRQLSKKVVKIYATRMQIEESFRDLKTGLKMNNCGTRNSPRLKVLLLVALVAQYLLFLLGLAVKSSGKHRRYQANSIKNRNVLSNQFIGLRAYKDKQLKLLKKHWQAAIDKLRTLIDDPQASF